MKYSTILLMLIAILFAGCTQKSIPVEGFIDVEGGKVWYKIVGADKQKTLLLLLHGGPEFPLHVTRWFHNSISQIYDKLNISFYDF